MPIKLLDPQVVARIAAGEVVERPASVVKELVENALDAGSSQITVEAMDGGVSLLRVTDNGTGIPAGEAAIAFQRHATSKITDMDDLESISTLGFRGEALASIAAVAEVELTTCAAGESVGSYLRLKDGTVVEQTSQGRSQGTTVTVKNLFRSVPARLKFLKSPGTENSHTANVVTQYALAFPEVKFTLSLDGRRALQTPGNGRLIDSTIEVYGLDVARNMLEVGQDKEWQGGTPNIAVAGMVGSPAISRANRNYLSFFVNRRWVNSRLLSWAVEEAYHGLLMTGKHPIAVLNVSLPVAEVDVNIHPAKTEIKFHNEHQVFSAVQRMVRRAILEPSAVPKIEDNAATYVAPPPVSQTLPIRLDNTTAPSTARPVPTTFSRPIPAFSLPALRLLGQIAGTYIVAEGPDGLYLIDQHAAHERILFERINAQRSEKRVEVQGLQPATFDVGPQQDAILRSHIEELSDSGFLLEAFGDRTYLVRTVPACLNRKDWLDVLRELTDIVEGDSNWPEKLAMTIACHSAIRAGQVLNDDEMHELLRQLENAAIPNSCPHGRPTMIHLSSGQLEKEFGRRG